MAGFRTREVYGAYPAKQHLECPERTRKEVSYPQDLKAEPSEALAGRMHDGVVFEDEWNEHQLKSWTDLGWDVCDVRIVGDDTAEAEAHTKRYNGLICSRSKKTRALRVRVEVDSNGNRSDIGRTAAETLTRAAIAAGVHVILGGRLTYEARVGEIDMLVRCDWDKNRRKHWKYHSVDIKHHRSTQGTAKPRPYKVTDPLDPAWDPDAPTMDIKGVPQLVDSMQLVHYHHILTGVGIAAEPIGGILGKEGVIVWRDLRMSYYQRGKASALEIADKAFDDMLEAIDHERNCLEDASIAPASGPEWKTACKECPWREVCRDELAAVDHITLMPGMTPTRAVGFYEVGVKDTKTLARLDHRTARLRAVGLNVSDALVRAETVKRTTPVEDFAGVEAIAYRDEGITTARELSKLDPVVACMDSSTVKALPGFIDQARVFSMQRVCRARGVDWVNIDRAAIELDFDIEDDSGGMCYLIGVTERIRTHAGVNRRFVPFVTWEHTDEAEADVFARFWAYLVETIDRAARWKRGRVRAYHYTPHERRYFKHLCEKHAGVPGVPTVEELDDVLFESGVAVDMYPIVAKQVVWPTEDHTLKSLAKYLKFFWRDEAPGGANSVAWYQIAVDDSHPDSADMRERILEYNEDDCDATHHIRDWLTRLGETRRPGKKLPSTADLDRRFSLQRRIVPLS